MGFTVSVSVSAFLLSFSPSSVAFLVGFVGLCHSFSSLYIPSVVLFLGFVYARFVYACLDTLIPKCSFVALLVKLNVSKAPLFWNKSVHLNSCFFFFKQFFFNKSMCRQALTLYPLSCLVFFSSPGIPVAVTVLIYFRILLSTSSMEFSDSTFICCFSGQ